MKNCDRFGVESQNIQIAMTKAYLYEATDIIARKGKEIILNMYDKEEQKKMMSVLHKKLQYQEWPDLIDLKTKIADKLIEENKYCF